MKLFGQLMRTVVNTVMLPVEVVKDAATLGGIMVDKDKSFTRERLEKLAEDAEEQ